MQSGIPFLVVSLLTILGLLLASCAPAAAPPPAKPAAPPAVKPAAPAPTPKPAAEQPKYGGVFTFLTDGDPPSFDGHQESTYMTFHAIGPCTSTLIQFDPMENTKVVPDLAQRWEASADGLTYTFYLHKGAKFHDGTTVTAEDARFSLDRIRKPPKGTVSPKRNMLDTIEAIEALDETTLKVIMKRPHPAIIPFLAHGWMMIYPKKAIEEKGDMKKDVVGTGPFTYKAYKRGVSHELVKFEDYFIKGRPYLDGIKIYIIKEAGSRLAALRAKRAMAILVHPSISPPEIEILKKEEPGIFMSSGLFPLPDNIIMNTRRKPWDNPQARLAIHLAVDRQAAVQFIQKGAGMVGGPMPPSGNWDIPQEELLKMPGFRQPKDADIAEAKKLLAEAGVVKGTKVNVVARKIQKDAAIFAQDTLAKLGFDATVDIQETAAAYERMRSSDFDVAAFASGPNIDDPDLCFTTYYTSNAARNYSGLTDPKLDELFEKQSRTLDPVARKKVVIEMQKLILKSPGMVQACWRVATMALWKEVRDYKHPSHTFHNTKFQDVWLAE
ncbi:MAG: ABC transporter substrate-binding protein [Chloroflexota bacterium]